jgi:hypothetical protein
VATERQRDQQRIVWDPDERDPGKTFPNVRNVHPIRQDLIIRFEDLLAKLPGDDMRVAEVNPRTRRVRLFPPPMLPCSAWREPAE